MQAPGQYQQVHDNRQSMPPAKSGGCTRGASGYAQHEAKNHRVVNSHPQKQPGRQNSTRRRTERRKENLRAAHQTRQTHLSRSGLAAAGVLGVGWRMRELLEAARKLVMARLTGLTNLAKPGSLVGVG